MAERPQLAPFWQNTRHRGQPIPVTSGGTYSAGGNISFTLPKIGFLNAITLRVAGTMTLSNTGVLTNRSPWDMLTRIKVNCNLGSMTVYDTTGYGNYIVQRMSRAGYDPAALADATVYAAPVVNGANTWALTYRIPIAANWHKQFGVGLLNLQAQELQVDVEATWASATNLISNFTSFAGTLSASYEYFEVPDPRYVEHPELVFHRIAEQRQTIAASGDQTVLVPRQGILYRLAHICQVNTAALTDPTDFRLIFNKSDRIYSEPAWVVRERMLRNYRSNLPSHVFTHDFWSAEGQPGEGNPRDMINSEALSTLESVFSTATSPSGTLNAVDTIREFAQVPSF